MLRFLKLSDKCAELAALCTLDCDFEIATTHTAGPLNAQIAKELEVHF
jgi:hypothetical protein